MPHQVKTKQIDKLRVIKLKGEIKEMNDYIYKSVLNIPLKIKKKEI